MAVEDEIKRRAAASLTLISLLVDEEKSPEKSATRQWLLLLLFCLYLCSLCRRHRFCFSLVAFLYFLSFQHVACFFKRLYKFWTLLLNYLQYTLLSTTYNTKKKQKKSYISLYTHTHTYIYIKIQHTSTDPKVFQI